jgi:hypothetical protein
LDSRGLPVLYVGTAIMELPSPPANVLDKRFFQVTGIVMVLVTLVAGSITVWLASEVTTLKQPDLIASTID